jgi:transcriptional regulator
MYVPTAFNQSDLPTIHAFIEQHSFAVLCSTGEDGSPFASHLPLLLDRQPSPHGALVGHLARANPQWRHADGRSVLAVFSGPHAYISPSWYEAREVVPTWNYVAVHVTGTLRAIHAPKALLEIVQRFIAFYEAPRPRPWELDTSGELLDRLLRAIVGFRIEISGIEGKWKLSQNKPIEARQKVCRALRQQGGEDAEALARLMEQIEE